MELVHEEDFIQANEIWYSYYTNHFVVIGCYKLISMDEEKHNYISKKYFYDKNLQLMFTVPNDNEPEMVVSKTPNQLVKMFVVDRAFSTQKETIDNLIEELVELQVELKRKFDDIKVTVRKLSEFFTLHSVERNT